MKRALYLLLTTFLKEKKTDNKKKKQIHSRSFSPIQSEFEVFVLKHSFGVVVLIAYFSLIKLVISN